MPKKDIMEYLDKHPEAKLEDLTEIFPDENPNSLNTYLCEWRRAHGLGKRHLSVFVTVHTPGNTPSQIDPARSWHNDSSSELYQKIHRNKMLHSSLFVPYDESTSEPWLVRIDSFQCPIHAQRGQCMLIQRKCCKKNCPKILTS